MELVRRVTSHFKFNNKSSIINLHPLNEQYYKLKMKYFNSGQHQRWISRSFFDYLNLKVDTTVLDLGCSFGVLWCQNVEKLKSYAPITLGENLLVNVRISQQNLKSRNINYPVELVGYKRLKFDDNSFNKVISRIDFEECSLSDQLIMIEECCRVVEPNGTCYFFIDNNQLTNIMNQLLYQFDSSLDIQMDPTGLERYEVESFLEKKFESIEIINYNNNSGIYEADVLINLLIAAKNLNFIDLIVKRHRIAEFTLFLTRYLEKYGPIYLNPGHKIMICNKKAQKCH